MNEEHQRTTHEEQMTKFHFLKNRQNIMKEDTPILQRQVKTWQSKSDTVTKVPKLTITPVLHFQSENYRLPSNKLFHNVYNSPQ